MLVLGLIRTSIEIELNNFFLKINRCFYVTASTANVSGYTTKKKAFRDCRTESIIFILYNMFETLKQPL